VKSTPRITIDAAMPERVDSFPAIQAKISDKDDKRVTPTGP
jgi:hypothetical protein